MSMLRFIQLISLPLYTRIFKNFHNKNQSSNTIKDSYQLLQGSSGSMVHSVQSFPDPNVLTLAKESCARLPAQGYYGVQLQGIKRGGGREVIQRKKGSSLLPTWPQLENPARCSFTQGTSEKLYGNSTAWKSSSKQK